MKKIAIVSSKGGHLGQMKLIFTAEVIGKDSVILITEDKIEHVQNKSYLGKYNTYFFKKDALGINPFAYIFRLFSLIRVFRKEKIEILFTNGAHMSIPAVMAAKILRIKSVFIDTVIRVKTPNWSARVSYLFADIFWVQHAGMVKKYGKKSKYVGGII